MTKCISSNVVKVGLKTKKILYMFSLVYEYTSILMKSWSSTKALIIKKDKCDHKFREFENFFLRETCFFLRLVTSVGQRKDSESSWGIELQTFGFRALMLYHWDSTVSEFFNEVHRTRVLHTARISNVDSVMFVKKIREMVSFEFGKEIEKNVFFFVLSRVWDKEKNIFLVLGLHESNFPELSFTWSQSWVLITDKLILPRD